MTQTFLIFWVCLITNPTCDITEDPPHFQPIFREYSTKAECEADVAAFTHYHKPPKGFLARHICEVKGASL